MARACSAIPWKYCINAPGNYPITGTVSDINNCSTTFTALIQAHPKPEADFYFTPENPIEGLEPVKFSTASPGAVKYSWFFDNQHRSQNPNPDFLFDKNGSYPVALIVSNQWQCSDTIVKPVTVSPDAAVYVPNAFTPNDDGLNDLFGPTLRGAKAFTLRVFDRWGEKIFETSDLNKAWDSTFKGQACKEEVYVWKLTVDFENKGAVQERKLQGRVLLIPLNNDRTDLAKFHLNTANQAFKLKSPIFQKFLSLPPNQYPRA